MIEITPKEYIIDGKPFVRMAITTEQRRMGGKKGGSSLKHKWTGEDRDIVRLLYKQNNKSTQHLASLLGVTFFAVKGQVQKLGLAKRTGRKWWDEKQDEQLRKLITRYAPVTVSKMMHRSVNSVVVRSKRLGISRRPHDDWYTKKEISEICGVDHKRVQQWIDSGILKASYHNGNKPQQHGMNMWHINRNDARKFIVNYVQEFNGRNVDLIHMVDIILNR